MVKRINVANGTLEVSEISLGCMRIADLSPKEAEVHIHSALEVGIDFLTMQIFMRRQSGGSIRGCTGCKSRHARPADDSGQMRHQERLL